MKGIQTLEELCNRNDITDLKEWIDRAIQELRPEGPNATHALAKLIKELLDCRNPNLPFILIVALELEPISDLIESISSIFSAPNLTPKPDNCRFISEICKENLIGWTDRTAEEIKMSAEVTLNALVKKQDNKESIKWPSSKKRQKQKSNNSYIREMAPNVSLQSKALEKSEEIKHHTKSNSTKELKNLINAADYNKSKQLVKEGFHDKLSQNKSIITNEEEISRQDIKQDYLQKQSIQNQEIETFLPINILEYAGFWKRFDAFFVDFVVLFFLCCILGIIMILIIGITKLNFNYKEFTILFRFLAFLMIWIYYAAFESSSYQATPGKMAERLVVTDLNLQRISFVEASGRFLGKIISGLILGIGYLMAGFTEKKQALHDMMVDCQVLKENLKPDQII